MKKCPVCGAVFEDNNVFFCTNCGANLVDEVVEKPASDEQEG